MGIVALILCTGLVVVLLRIERRRNKDASLALWIPTIWMLIYASRPVGLWVGYTSSDTSIEAGSPLDRLVLGILIIVAFLILFKRKIEWSRILKDNFWLILAFVYMGVSILWSDIPFVSLKRWVRATGDILVASMVLSELMPLQALESVFRRVAYVLIPFSVVLAKYFPHLGRSYSYSGGEMWTGVAQSKNALGELCALSAFLLIWALLREWRSGNLFKNRSQTFADASVLAIAVFLLRGPGGAYPATSVVTLIVGVALLLLLRPKRDLTAYVARHLKAFAISLTTIYLLFYDSFLRIVAPLLGRDETLTSRTETWRPLLDFASHSPILGVGYGGFYEPGNAELVAAVGPRFILAQVHSGYLAIYIELGIVGIIVLAAFLLSYCGRARAELPHSFDWGVYAICLLPMSLLYNISEVSFLGSSTYLWSTIVLVTIVLSGWRRKQLE
jgi:exopolysaccharide production protein ExoQ